MDNGIFVFCGTLWKPGRKIAGAQFDIDRARRELEDARRAYTDIDNSTRSAEQNVNRIRADIDNARIRQRELPLQIDNDKRRIDILKDEVVGIMRTFNQTQKDLADVQKGLADRRERLRGLQLDITSAKSVADGIRSVEIARFEASAEYKKEQTELDILQSRYDAAVAKCLEQLATNTTYTNAVAEAALAEEAVIKLRGAAEKAEITAASQKWITAKSRVEVIKSEKVAADPNVIAAKADLAKQQMIVKTLRSRFEEQLRMMPQMTDATQKMEDSKVAFTSANTEIRRLDADVNTMNKQLVQQKNMVANNSRLVAVGTDLVRRKELDLRQLETDLVNLDRDMRDAEFQADRNRTDRASAARRVRNAEEDYRRAGGRQ